MAVMPTVIFDPNVAFVLLILGLLAVFWELHSPGIFVPGVAGLVLVAMATYGLYRDAPSWPGVLLLAFAIVLLGIELKYYTHMISGVVGSILLAVGAIILLRGPQRISPPIAIAMATAFGIIVVFLGFLAVRARRTKPATGLQALIGETGIAHTDIAPDGTVMVHGEYWHAHSSESIPAGRRVSVRAVEALNLYVEACK